MDHLQWLKKYCRLCKTKIKFDKAYTQAKECRGFQESIVSVYGITCHNEDENVYPNLLCKNCCRNVVRDANNGKKKEPAIFSTHNEHCEICAVENKLSAPKNTTLNKHNLDKLFQSNGFFVCSKSPSRTYSKLNVTNGKVIPVITININEDCTWSVVVLGKSLPCDEIFPAYQFLNDNNAVSLISDLTECKICFGNNKYPDVVQSRIVVDQPFPSNSGGISAIVESDECCIEFRKHNFNSVRHPNCSLLYNSEKEMCDNCCSLDKTFKVFQKRIQEPIDFERRTSDISTTNLRHLSKDELIARLQNTQIAKREAIRKIVNLQSKINQMIEDESVELNETNHEIVKVVLDKEKPEFPEGTPQWLLWQEQQKMSKLKNSRSMRWHPLIVRWCLSIYHKSPAAYKQIANTKNNFLKLPHVNTIKRYTNFTKPTSGFNPDIIKRLIIDSNLEKLDDLKRNVVILFDEMKIKADLIYSRSTGKLVGFTDMGNVNEEIRKLQDKCNEKEPHQRELTRYVNVYMARGIFTKLKYPFGFFGSQGFTSDQLYPCTLEATRVLESIGFKVRAWICDGASPNRKFFTISQSFSKDGDTFYWTENPFDQTRKLYFSSDYPHLLKTTRNCLENSHGNSNTRNLHYNGQDIGWNHIVQVYEWDLNEKSQSYGLRVLNKLTEDHIKLTPRLRMKVKLAAQVLSAHMANALKLQNEFYTEGTRNFIKIFDRLFDCLNGQSYDDYGKPDRAPYRKVDDARFTFLNKVLTYLDDWEKEAKSLTQLTVEEQAKRCLSKQTVFGWRMTIHTFMDLTKELLNEGARFVLSEKFSQDPLEEHFGRQRAAGGANENPTYLQFEKQEVSLNLMSSELINELQGSNVSRKDSTPLDINDQRTLPRKEIVRKKAQKDPK